MASRASPFDDAVWWRRRISPPTPEIPKNAGTAIDQNAWIEIAAARAHDHAAAQGQSHARVDRLTGFDRGYAGTISKVGDDKSLRQIVSKLAHDRFARKTMKPMALDPLQPQFLGNRKYPADSDEAARL